MAPLQASLGVAAVHVLGGRPLQHGGQQGVRRGVLQVEDARGPAPPRGVVQGDGPPLRVILTHTHTGTQNERERVFDLCKNKVPFQSSQATNCEKNTSPVVSLTD